MLGTHEKQDTYTVHTSLPEGPGRDDAKILWTGPSPRGWHRLQLFAECPQKYSWTYNNPKGKSKGVKASPALAKGSLFHLVMAQHYARMREIQEGRDRENYLHPVEALQIVAQVEGVSQYVEGITETYQAYCQTYPFEEELATMRILEVEELAQTIIGDRYLLTGRRDLVYEDLGGRVRVMDHKTSARVTANHKNYYGISGQLYGYAHMAREQYGDRFAGMQVNLAQHGGGRFERVDLPRSMFIEQQFEKIVLDLEHGIERLDAEGRPFDEWPKAVSELVCYTRYGPCPFVDQCRNGKAAKKAGSWSLEGF